MMSQIRPMRPVAQKFGTKDERKYLDSFRHAPVCEGCYRPNDGTIVGAHLNSVSAGSGRGFKTHGAVVALCRQCHDLIDWRVPLNDWTRQERARTIYRIAIRLATERAQREHQS